MKTSPLGVSYHTKSALSITNLPIESDIGEQTNTTSQATSYEELNHKLGGKPMRIQLYISEKVRSVDINNKLVTTLLRLLESVAGHVVTDENPDIVHFFGCWDSQMAHAATNIKRRLIPYVYSPLGGLQPWEVEYHKMAKHTQMMAFQRKMTHEAAVVHHE